MVDSMLGGLFGGPDADRMRSQARDFVGRYETGQPHEGYTNDEVMERFRQVQGRVSDDDMRDAARQAFGRMSPEQRREYRRAMKQRGARGFDRDDEIDPDILAQQTQGFMKEQPDQDGGGIMGFLGDVFGYNQPDPRQQAQHQQQVQQQQGSMMDNPAVKAAMAGMAAFAMKKVLDNR